MGAPARGRTTKANASKDAWEEGCALRMEHFGSMLRFIVPPRLSLLFFQTLLQQGVYCWEARTCFLTTAHTEADVKLVVEACKRATRVLREHGVELPPIE